MEISTFITIYKLQKQIDELSEMKKAVYYAVNSPSLSGIRSTSPADPTAKAFYKLQAIDEKITEAILKRSAAASSALRWMYTKPVPVTVRRILINRYMMCLSWKDTGRRIGSNPETARIMLYRYFKDNAAQDTGTTEKQA